MAGSQECAAPPPERWVEDLQRKQTHDEGLFGGDWLSCWFTHGSPACTQSAVQEIPAGHKRRDPARSLVLWSADAVPGEENTPSGCTIPHYKLPNSDHVLELISRSFVVSQKKEFENITISWGQTLSSVWCLPGRHEGRRLAGFGWVFPEVSSSCLQISSHCLQRNMKRVFLTMKSERSVVILKWTVAKHYMNDVVADVFESL